MIFRLLFYAALVAIAAGIAGALITVLRRPLKPFARNLLIFLVVFEVITAGLHLYALNADMPHFWSWFFNVQYEFNLGSIFSALQLIVIALAALAAALLTPALRTWQRLYFLLLVALFVFLSLDEFFSFHETLGGRHVTEAWRIPYAIGGAILFATTVLAFLAGFRAQVRLFVLLFMGLVIMGAAGVGVEEFVLRGFVQDDPRAEWMYVFEEVFEMVGATIILSGFIAYLQDYVPDRRWPTTRRLLLWGSVVYVGFLLFSWLLLPLLEARVAANPLHVRYESGLELVGYRAAPAQVRPGDEVELTLYWRAAQPLDENYSLSVHVLSHPDIGSVAQSDDLHIGSVPTGAWFPHVVTRRTVYIRLPRDLPVPASYWLMVRAWYGPWPLGRPWQDTTGVPIADAGGAQLLADDAVIVEHIPALAAEPPPAPAQVADFRFPSEGFALAGVTIPADPVDTRALPVSFAWATDRAGTRDLTQFFHLVPDGGGEVIAFDQPPFGGRLPTSDWPAGMRATDAWTVMLPADLPPGHYRVMTGLYDVTTMERVAVTDANGAPIPDSAIPLGSVEFAPGADAAVEATPEPDVLDAEDYCYAMSDADPRLETLSDTTVAIHRHTGEAVYIGPSGSDEVESLAFGPDGATLYTVDERTLGQFGTVDRRTGAFTRIGSGLVTKEDPARNAALGTDILADVDGLALEPSTGELWATTQDKNNHLFRIDPATGTVVRDAFGPGTDYLRIDLGGLPGDIPYTNVEDLAIDPATGRFYVIAKNDERGAMLAALDWEREDRQAGTVPAIAVGGFVDAASGEAITDVEALSFHHDGTLYAVSTDNANEPQYRDALWRVDTASARSTWISTFVDDVDPVDYEGLACLSVATGD